MLCFVIRRVGVPDHFWGLADSLIGDLLGPPVVQLLVGAGLMLGNATALTALLTALLNCSMLMAAKDSLIFSY